MDAQKISEIDSSQVSGENVADNARTGSILSWVGTVVVAVGCLMMTACSSGPEKAIGSVDGPYQNTTILPGDVIKISFPGATNLNMTVAVPLNGDIQMAFGEAVNATGKTPDELQADLLDKFGPQLVQKEIDVSILQSGAVIYVTGAVLAPSQVPMTRALTVLDAIMAAGGPVAASAKLDSVTIIRDFEGQHQTFVVDIQAVIDGKIHSPFYLRPFDKVIVPQRRFNF